MLNECFLPVRLILLQWGNSEEKVTCGLRRFLPAPPFFVCYLDPYHPKCVVSGQSGGSCFPLSVCGPPVSTRCMISCHLAPAPISLLRPSCLPAVTMGTSMQQLASCWIWCFNLCFPLLGALKAYSLYVMACLGEPCPSVWILNQSAFVQGLAQSTCGAQEGRNEKSPPRLAILEDICKINGLFTVFPYPPPPPCAQSPLTVTLFTVAHQASLSLKFSRQEYWSELPFPTPGDLLDAGSLLHLLHWQVNSLPLCHLGSPTSPHLCFIKQTGVQIPLRWLFWDISLPSSPSACVLNIVIFLVLFSDLMTVLHPTPVLLPGKSHGQRSLGGCSPWGR